jgi:hypothetical protein
MSDQGKRHRLDEPALGYRVAEDHDLGRDQQLREVRLRLSYRVPQRRDGCKRRTVLAAPYRDRGPRARHEDGRRFTADTERPRRDLDYLVFLVCHRFTCSPSSAPTAVSPLSSRSPAAAPACAPRPAPALGRAAQRQDAHQLPESLTDRELPHRDGAMAAEGPGCLICYNRRWRRAGRRSPTERRLVAMTTAHVVTRPKGGRHQDLRLMTDVELRRARAARRPTSRPGR